jgi:hypothetical protein
VIGTEGVERGCVDLYLDSINGLVYLVRCRRLGEVYTSPHTLKVFSHVRIIHAVPFTEI